MQITLSQQNLQAAVLLFIKERFNLEEDESVSVEFIEDGAVVLILSPGEEHEDTVLVSNTSSGASDPSGTKPTRRPRRTKAQIAADEAAAQEAARLAEQQQSGGGDVPPQEGEPKGDNPPAEEPVNQESPSPEQSSGPALAVNAELKPADDTPVGGEAEPINSEPEPVEETQPDPVPEAKPTASLFANLRKPVNS